MAGKTASSVPGSMMEGLSNILPDIALCMAAPDADIPFLTKMQQAVLLRIHQPAPKPQGPAAPGSGAPQSAGAGEGAPGGPPAGLQGQGLPGGPPGAGAANGQMKSQGAPQAPAQPGGGVSKPINITPDELRRELAMQAGE